eukprot:jgi/Chrzof1/15051/Cz09g25100.t1
MSGQQTTRSSADDRMAVLSDHLHKALLPILSNQPSNPLIYLCSFFNDFAYGGNELSMAYKLVCLCPPEGQQFMENLTSAFTVLAGSQPCISPTHYLQIGNMLCSGMQPQGAQQMQQVMRKAAKPMTDNGSQLEIELQCHLGISKFVACLVFWCANPRFCCQHER